MDHHVHCFCFSEDTGRSRDMPLVPRVLGKWTNRPGYQTVLVCLVLILSIGVYNMATNVHLAPHYVRSGDQLQFIHYVPSALEEAWYEKRSTYDSDPSKICEDLQAYEKDLKSWIAYTSNATESKIPDGIFSKAVFKTSGQKEYTRLIEPLVGHFRHPFALPHCKPEGIDAVDVQDRSYIAFAGNERLKQSVFPGKRYLFDMGTATFGTSLGYIISKFSQFDVQFDRIWAWEANAMSKYWESVPDTVQGKLHFYNYPISSSVTSPSHPLQILKQQYQVGDYVVVKLDIDNSELELAIMKEIERDTELRGMISELMFEMHYNSRDMQLYFGTPSMSYIETFETMRQFREMGLFLHYWP